MGFLNPFKSKKYDGTNPLGVKTWEGSVIDNNGQQVPALQTMDKDGTIKVMSADGKAVYRTINPADPKPAAPYTGDAAHRPVSDQNVGLMPQTHPPQDAYLGTNPQGEAIFKTPVTDNKGHQVSAIEEVHPDGGVTIMSADGKTTYKTISSPMPQMGIEDRVNTGGFSGDGKDVAITGKASSAPLPTRTTPELSGSLGSSGAPKVTVGFAGTETPDHEQAAKAPAEHVPVALNSPAHTGAGGLSTMSPPAYKGGAPVVNVERPKLGATITTTASGAQVEQVAGHTPYQVSPPVAVPATPQQIETLDPAIKTVVRANEAAAVETAQRKGEEMMATPPAAASQNQNLTPAPSPVAVDGYTPYRASGPTNSSPPVPTASVPPPVHNELDPAIAAAIAVHTPSPSPVPTPSPVANVGATLIAPITHPDTTAGLAGFDTTGSANTHVLGHGRMTLD